MKFEFEIKIEQQKILTDNIAIKLNSLIVEALCKKLGIENVNPYNYINRMARTPFGGGDIISLDAEPILFIQLVADDTPWLSDGIGQEIKFGITIKWRFF